jgi:hypothetical protein
VTACPADTSSGITAAAMCPEAPVTNTRMVEPP